jgi:hypothetical protein
LLHCLCCHGSQLSRNTEPFPSKSHLCWFRSSGFELSCHNMYSRMHASQSGEAVLREFHSCSFSSDVTRAVCHNSTQFMSIGFMLIHLHRIGRIKFYLKRRSWPWYLIKEVEDTNNLFHLPYVPLQATRISHEAFHDAVCNKGVIEGDNVKWFILYIYI